MPIILVAMYLVFSAAAYPFGVLADHIDRHLQLGMGTIVLVFADLVLASADTLWMTMLGGGLWGLQMGMTQVFFPPPSPTPRPNGCAARHSASST